MSWKALPVVLFVCICCVVHDTRATVIADVTLISPERAAPLEHAYVRIENGRIEEVSTAPVKGTPQIDGRGKFLIPGLIDTHTHLGQVPGMVGPQLAAHPDLVATAQAQEPRSYLYFGFTTVLSLGDTAEPIKRWNALAVRPDAYFCGATPIFRGYSYRGPTASPYFLFNPDQAESLPASVDKAQHTPEVVVPRMANDGAICVKSYRETGFGRDTGRLPAPSVEMIRAVVAAAHARNLPVFLHANSMQAQAFAVEAGVDVIAHGMWNGHESTATSLDAGVEPIVKGILARGMGYQPTAQVPLGLAGVLDDKFFADPLLSQVYSPELIAWYRSPEGRWFRNAELGGARPNIFEQGESYGAAVVRVLARNNGRLLFGTDTPSAPVYSNPPGLNGFYEMHRWIAAGVSTKQLFQAVTIENARIMRLDREIGSIEKGKRAHLLLLRANPLGNIEAYNTIETVFVAGTPIPRERLAVSSLR
jgi:imidazolonepropionase-like amidohydrolase